MICILIMIVDDKSFRRFIFKNIYQNQSYLKLLFTFAMVETWNRLLNE